MVRPRQATALTEAAAAVWNAENYVALGLLHKSSLPGAAALRALVYNRSLRPELALREFEAHALDSLDPAEALMLSLSSARASADLGDFARARETLASAEAFASGDPLLEIARLHGRAMVEYLAGRFDFVEEHASAALDLIERHPYAEARTEYQFELNHLRARVLELTGALHALHGEFEQLQSVLVEALLQSRLVRNRDYWLEAMLVANLAVLVAQLPNPRTRQLVMARAAEIPWNHDLDARRMYVHLGLTQHRRLFGADTLAGNDLGATAHSFAWRLVSCVEALGATDFEAPESFHEELRFADSLADRVGRAERSGEEWRSLLLLSSFVATCDAGRAKVLAERYASGMQTLSNALFVVHSPTRKGEEAFAGGCVAKAEGNFGGAAERLKESADTWARLGLPQWVATAGLERFTITRDDDDLRAARSFVRKHPATSFSRRLERALAAAPAAAVGDFIYVNPWRVSADVSG
jgi:hypothetical protein